MSFRSYIDRRAQKTPLHVVMGYKFVGGPVFFASGLFHLYRYSKGHEGFHLLMGPAYLLLGCVTAALGIELGRAQRRLDREAQDSGGAE